jgi:hypothetical protein
MKSSRTNDCVPCSTADLMSMNESFVRARTIFDRMMEESLARHSECMVFFLLVISPR